MTAQNFQQRRRLLLGGSVSGTLIAGTATYAFGGNGTTAGTLTVNGGTLDAALDATITNALTLGANLERLTLSGSAVAGNGNALGNLLTGNALANTLDGKADATGTVAALAGKVSTGSVGPETATGTGTTFSTTIAAPAHLPITASVNGVVASTTD